MERQSGAVIGAILLLGLGGGIASAQPAGEGTRLNFEAADTDGDGYVSEAEIAVDMAAAFNALDKDHDRFLEPEELEGAGSTAVAPVDADKATAEHDHGVLTLRLPKAEAARPRQIKVGSTAGTGK